MCGISHFASKTLGGTGWNFVFHLDARKNFNARPSLAKPWQVSFIATANILIITKISELVKKVGRLLFPRVCENYR